MHGCRVQRYGNVAKIPMSRSKKAKAAFRWRYSGVSEQVITNFHQRGNLLLAGTDDKCTECEIQRLRFEVVVLGSSSSGRNNRFIYSAKPALGNGCKICLWSWTVVLI